MLTRSVVEKKTDRGTERFEGHAHYKADDNGVVSVPDQVSLGGTYTGNLKDSLPEFVTNLQVIPGNLI